MFDEIVRLADDPERLLAAVAQTLAGQGELHRLFDLRLMAERRRLGLPLDRRTSIDDVEEPLRSQLEAGYLAACREVGELLLDAGRLREAWMYLRPAGDKLPVRQRLARLRPDDERVDELIELALFEGIDPERGYAWLLGRQGTCNGITTLGGMEPQLSAADLRACAAVLVRHVYGELRGNLRGHLERLQPGTPSDFSVAQLVERFPELTSGGAYHLDTSHLSSTMRFARELVEPALVGMALEMAEYGARLPQDLQYPGEPPFEETYVAHPVFFRAVLGQDVDAAVDYFGRRARGEADDAARFAAAEALLTVLLRSGRAAEALETYAELVPAGRDLSARAPTLLELAAASGAWDRYLEICESRNDLLGIAAGLLTRGRQA